MIKKIIFILIFINMANNNVDKPIDYSDLDIYSDYIKGWEGKSLKAYKPVPTEENFTIGYGHYGSDVQEGDVWSDAQADAQLRTDIDDRLPAIKGSIKNFDSLPMDLKKNIVGSWFRGSMSGSPKTIELINQGKYKEASEEFLNNDEYKNAEKLGKSGIIPRMDATANSLLEYGQALDNSDKNL